MSADRQRIDKWLFFARVAKSRTLAAKLAQGGHVRVNGAKIGQASHEVKPGDVLTVTLERRVLVYKVVDCGARRGPAPEAQLLYEDLSPPSPVEARQRARQGRRKARGRRGTADEEGTPRHRQASRRRRLTSPDGPR